MKMILLLLITILLTVPVFAKDTKTGTVKIYDDKFKRVYTIRDNRVYEGAGFKQKGWVIGDKVYDTKFERKGYIKK